MDSILQRTADSSIEPFHSENDTLVIVQIN